MAQYNKIYQDIGENILNLRKNLGLKQQEFANKLNDFLRKEFGVKEAKYDYKTISNWEMGKSIPKIEVLIAICKHYGLSLDDLLKGKIKDIVSKSSFSNSEEDLLDEFIHNPAVCIKKNGKYESAFNPDMYKYGQLSYLADNLIEYRGEMSKNFSFTNPTKTVDVIVGILDINDGKHEFHTLGCGENDIVSIENIPSNYSLNYDVEYNSIIKTIGYNDILNIGHRKIIKLGNGNTFVLDEIPKDNPEDFAFDKDNLPKDLKELDLTEKDNWFDYTYAKSIAINDKIFSWEDGFNSFYYEKAGLIVSFDVGTIKCTDAQLIKVLSDDYKHRLIKNLENVSNDAICELYQTEVGIYKYGKEEEINKAKGLLKELKYLAKNEVNEGEKI